MELKRNYKENQRPTSGWQWFKPKKIQESLESALIKMKGKTKWLYGQKLLESLRLEKRVDWAHDAFFFGLILDIGFLNTPPLVSIARPPTSIPQLGLCRLFIVLEAVLLIFFLCRVSILEWLLFSLIKLSQVSSIIQLLRYLLRLQPLPLLYFLLFFRDASVICSAFLVP